MINLFINYFEHPDRARKQEIDFCLKANINNKHISNIIVLNEGTLPYNHKKITELPVKSRPTFQHFFDLTHDYSENDFNIIANSDIFFDDTVVGVKNLNDSKAYAITRCEYNGGDLNEFTAHNRCPPHYSQDVWAFKGHVKINNCREVMAQNLLNNQYNHIPFTMGVPGCDNVIAYYISMKYVVKNPHNIINCIHVHTNRSRPRYTYRMTGNMTRWGYLKRVPTSEL